MKKVLAILGCVSSVVGVIILLFRCDWIINVLELLCDIKDLFKKKKD